MVDRRVVRSFYENSKARVKEDVSMRQGCVLSALLYNLFMDGVLREWKARILNVGVCLDERDGRKRRVSSLFADVAVLIVKNACR